MNQDCQQTWKKSLAFPANNYENLEEFFYLPELNFIIKKIKSILISIFHSYVLAELSHSST